MNELETIAPVVAVRGNIEEDEVVRKLPNRVKVARWEFPDARVVVFGHSHSPWNEDVDGRLLFNPGSAMDRRGQPGCSVGVLYVDEKEKRVWGEIIWL